MSILTVFSCLFLVLFVLVIRYKKKVAAIDLVDPCLEQNRKPLLVEATSGPDGEHDVVTCNKNRCHKTASSIGYTVY